MYVLLCMVECCCAVQIGLFAVPFVTIVGWILGHPFSLGFDPFAGGFQQQRPSILRQNINVCSRAQYQHSVLLCEDDRASPRGSLGLVGDTVACDRSEESSFVMSKCQRRKVPRAERCPEGHCSVPRYCFLCLSMHCCACFGYCSVLSLRQQSNQVFPPAHSHPACCVCTTTHRGQHLLAKQTLFFHHSTHRLAWIAHRPCGGKLPTHLSSWCTCGLCVPLCCNCVQPWCCC